MKGMKEVAARTGTLSINSDNIFPIIKKWLYSEKEIFLREITSNACDAVTKLRRLVSLGQAHDLDLSDAKIVVRLASSLKVIMVNADPKNTIIPTITAFT